MLYVEDRVRVKNEEQIQEFAWINLTYKVLNKNR